MRDTHSFTGRGGTDAPAKVGIGRLVDHPGRTGRTGRTLAPAVIAVVVAVRVAAVGQVHAAPARVSLLPSTRLRAQGWEWTPTCRFAPRTSTAWAPSGPDLASAQL